MKNGKTIVIISVVAAALGVAPMVISSFTDKKIEEYKAMLANNGFKQEITKKEGYFVTKRDFTLEVVDASKAMNFLLGKVVEKNKQYDALVKVIKEEIKPDDVNVAFNGLKFRGQMEHSNLLPADRKASLIWDRLPSSVTDEDTKKIMNPLLARGVFAFDIAFDASHAIKQVVARDIKEKIAVDEENTIDINTVGHKLDLSVGSDVTKGRLEFGKQFLQASSKDPYEGNVSSDLEKMVYNFSVKDDFNGEGDLTLGKYSFVAGDGDEQTFFGLNGAKASSKVQDKNDKVQMVVDYFFDGLTFSDSMEKFGLQALNVKIGIDGLTTSRLKKIQQAYNGVVMQTGSNMSAEQQKALEGDVVGLINDGMKLTLNVGLKGLTSPMTAIKDGIVDATFEIPKNSFNKGQGPFALLSLLDASAKIKIHKEDRATLEAFGLLPKRYFELGVAKDEYVAYDLVMKQGKLTLNGQPVQ